MKQQLLHEALAESDVDNILREYDPNGEEVFAILRILYTFQERVQEGGDPTLIIKQTVAQIERRRQPRKFANQLVISFNGRNKHYSSNGNGAQHQNGANKK